MKARQVHPGAGHQGGQAGQKIQGLDHHLRLDAALFYNKYKDIQGGLGPSCPQFTYGIAALPCTVTANIGDADVKGAELEAQFHPIGGLSIDGSASYIQFKYTEFNPNTGLNPATTLPAGIIPHKYSAGIQYEEPLGSIGSVTPRLDWSYEGGYYTQPTPGLGDFLPGYQILNLRLSWKGAKDKWEAALAVTNLADKLYAHPRR
ncbi:MAG TPA: TonB-dependent receptor [Steroidobacteraceae bacterium]